MISELLNKILNFSTPNSNYNYINYPDIIDNELEILKTGGKIHIKKKNRGKFTDYCGGKVTSECIKKGKSSSNPTIRKRAVFAENARKWKK